MGRTKDIAFWRDAADRKRAEGEHATAITFDNMAWLLSHPEGWLAWIEEQRKVVEAKAISQPALE